MGFVEHEHGRPLAKPPDVGRVTAREPLVVGQRDGGWRGASRGRQRRRAGAVTRVELVDPALVGRLRRDDEEPLDFTRVPSRLECRERDAGLPGTRHAEVRAMGELH